MPDDFLSRMNPEHRGLLEQIGEEVRLHPRDRLIRRGDPAGDVFRVERGQVHVVDNRSRPEIVLGVMGPGDILGEMAFVDGTPRSADVIAADPCIVTRWPKEGLERLLAEKPDFAASFWKALASTVSDRLRRLVVPSTQTVSGPGDEAATSARNLGASIAESLAKADRGLRKDAASDEDRNLAFRALDDLTEGLIRLDTECGTRLEMVGACRIVWRSVEPFLVQSATGDLCRNRRDGSVPGLLVLRHLLTSQPAGDSPLGRVVDAWLQERAISEGLRSRQAVALQILERPFGALPPVCNALLLHAGAGDLVPTLHMWMGQRQGVMTVVEGRRELLTELGQLLPQGAGPTLQWLMDDLAELPVARSFKQLPKQDFILLDGVLEYLPTRVATRTLQQLASLLTPSGLLVCTTLGPSPDSVLWEYLLEWPTIRRDEDSLRAILGASGYRYLAFPATQAAGVVLLAGDASDSQTPAGGLASGSLPA